MGARVKTQLQHPRRCLAAAGLTGLLSAAVSPAQAWALDPPAAPRDIAPRPIAGLERIVELRDGQAVPGRLMAEVPGQYVLLQLATGEVRRFEWSELVAVRTVDLPPTAAPVPDFDPRAVAVSVEGEPRVRLSVRTGERESPDWQPICNLPCERILFREYQYRVDGHGLSAGTFQLPSSGTAVRVQVRVGSQASRTAGAVMLAVGLPTTAAGIGVLFANFIGAILGGSDLWKVGTPLFIAGTPLVIGGAVLLARSSTNIKIIPQPGGTAALQLRLANRLWLTQAGLLF